MNDLFASAVPPERVLSERFRVHPVIGDGMEPLLRGNRDYVLTAPVTTYQGEGIYLLDDGLSTALYRVSPTLDHGRLMLTRENPRYKTHLLEKEAFDERVMAIVVADIRTRDERFLRDA